METAVAEQIKSKFKIGDWVEVSPELTNLDKWILVTIFDIIKNPFLGDEIAVKDTLGNVFFGEQMYFRKARKVK